MSEQESLFGDLFPAPPAPTPRKTRPAAATTPPPTGSSTGVPGRSTAAPAPKTASSAAPAKPPTAPPAVTVKRPPSRHVPLPKGVKACTSSGRELAAGSVLAVFAAGWCPPTAAALHAALDALPVARRGTTVVYIDVDAHPHLADRWRVQALPTSVALHDGDEKGRAIGPSALTGASDLAGRLAAKRR